jgi:hypothetical protein
MTLTSICLPVASPSALASRPLVSPDRRAHLGNLPVGLGRAHLDEWRMMFGSSRAARADHHRHQGRGRRRAAQQVLDDLLAPAPGCSGRWPRSSSLP